MARKTSNRSVTLDAVREWIHLANGKWQISVKLPQFGTMNEIFLSSQEYTHPLDALKNYRLIFHGEWSGDECDLQDGNEETSNGPNASSVPNPGTDSDNR